MNENSTTMLLQYINDSPTSYHATANACAQLQREGFTELREADKWDIQKGGRYFVTKNGSAFLAFITGTENPVESGIRMIAAHTDSPCFQIKPNAEMHTEGVYCKLNTAAYGSPILSSWFDRPLAIAGRVLVRGSHTFAPRVVLVNIAKPVIVIPNLAIHLNEEANKGYVCNTQKDTLPLAGLIHNALETDGRLLRLLCAETGLEAADILDFDLFLYEHTPAALVGIAADMISAPRLDDLWMVHAGLTAICSAKPAAHTQVLLGTDNEEVGSLTPAGAESAFAADCLRRIAASSAYQLAASGENPAEDFRRMMAQSFIVSADLAHAVHPNHPDKHDPTTRPILGGGMVVKHSVNRRYATDGIGAAIFTALCQRANLPCQAYVNRSDVKGGTTIGATLSAQLAARVVDVGAPILAMHSARELAAAADVAYAVNTFKAIYSTTI